MRTILLAVLSLISGTVLASDPTDSLDLELLKEQLRKIDSIESKLHYKTGTITLKDGIASVNIPANFKFLDADESNYILEEVWGNLKGQTSLGMLVPAESRASIADYAFLIEYNDIGYVKDNDAGDINYDELLQQMKEESAEANKERVVEGISSMNLVGWASKPYYDKERNVLHWAKEFRVAGSEMNTLNYDVRVLGRKGVLVLQAVSGMDQMDSVRQNITPLLNAVSFTEGNRYADFNASTDNVAAWTIGGLVAGKVLAKAGFFAVLLKFGKFIVLAIAAMGAAIWKYFKGKKEEEQVPVV